MDIVIQALTPIWTGGVGGKADRLHESGIIGSLRWWYEAVVRGVGGYACANSCELHTHQKAEHQANLCPVCYLFGCGGWKRRFRLVVSAEENVPFQLATLNTKDQGKNDEKGNRWWLNKIFSESAGENLPLGKVRLSFTHIRDDNVRGQIEALISVIAHIGAIGAKTQYGFGQFDFEDKENKLSLDESIRRIREFAKGNRFLHPQNQKDLYSLEKFWFYELLLTPQNPLVNKFLNENDLDGNPLPKGYLPFSFDIRYKLPKSSNKGLRQAYYNNTIKQGSTESKAKQQTQKIFGTSISENDRRGSRVFVSHLFKKNSADEKNYLLDVWVLRAWGFTDEEVGRDVGTELKEIFSLPNLPSMKTGKGIVGGMPHDL